MWRGHEEEKDRKIVCRLKVICYLIDVRIDSNNNNNQKHHYHETLLRFI